MTPLSEDELAMNRVNLILNAYTRVERKLTDRAAVMHNIVYTQLDTRLNARLCVELQVFMPASMSPRMAVMGATREWAASFRTCPPNE